MHECAKTSLYEKQKQLGMLSPHAEVFHPATDNFTRENIAVQQATETIQEINNEKKNYKLKASKVQLDQNVSPKIEEHQNMQWKTAPSKCKIDNADKAHCTPTYENNIDKNRHNALVEEAEEEEEAYDCDHIKTTNQQKEERKQNVQAPKDANVLSTEEIQKIIREYASQEEFTVQANAEEEEIKEVKEQNHKKEEEGEENESAVEVDSVSTFGERIMEEEESEMRMCSMEQHAHELEDELCDNQQMNEELKAHVKILEETMNEMKNTTVKEEESLKDKNVKLMNDANKIKGEKQMVEKELEILQDLKKEITHSNDEYERDVK